MRQDQFEKLKTLEEKLLDVFISEADPEAWPGKGIAIGAMDNKTRGDLYWCRKTAASVLVLTTRVQALICQAQGRAPDPAAQPASEGYVAAAAEEAAEQQIDAAYARAEREAQRLMRELQGATPSAVKQEFDRRVQGSSGQKRGTSNQAAHGDNA